LAPPSNEATLRLGRMFGETRPVGAGTAGADFSQAAGESLAVGS
jgi:hypothetical protein